VIGDYDFFIIINNFKPFSNQCNTFEVYISNLVQYHYAMAAYMNMRGFLVI
jgi:hypothetical protein